jgi:hypothetical protein
MQRLIEQPVAEGEVIEGTTPRGRVHYHLSIYQHFADDGGDPVSPNLEVEGRVIATDRFDVAGFFASGAELTLCLADGRQLDFRIVGDDGTIHSTARGLYRPE